MNIIEQIKKHDILLDLLADKEIHYVDVPLYPNIGDHLITHGAFEFFKKNNIKIKRSIDLYHYSLAWKDEVDVVVFSGGGNLGDIWREHSNARLDLIGKLRGKKIIILPQTIRYKDQRNFKEDVSIFNRYENVYICARDNESFDYARKMTPNAYLLPDMAVNLWDRFSVYREIEATERELNFFRQDKESALDTIPENSVDWDLLITKYELRDMYKISKYLNRLLRFGLLGPFSNLCMKLWEKQSLRVIDRIARDLSRYSAVNTDRLHVTILFSLMGRKVIYVDNENSKLSSYISLWGK